MKVNDRRGNPIEIAAMVVWHVQDTAQAMFDVDDFDCYVTTQAETALRHVATAYAYDHGDDESAAEITLVAIPMRCPTPCARSRRTALRSWRGR